jgi:hypothetical protein
MSGWLRTMWRWSWLVTLPVTTVFVWWLSVTLRQWHRFTNEYDARPAVVTLHEAGVDNWNHVVRAAALSLTPGDVTDVPRSHQLRSVQLFVNDSDIAKLGADLPYSGFEFVDGQLVFPDGPKEVKVRYRGDFLVHWGYEKKSIRIKTKSSDLFDGMRAFNLIVPKFPEQINNYISYRLAGLLGLITPRCELVNVFLNGENMGLHELTEQIEEGTLRRHDRMPGDIYSGDLIAKDQMRGTTNRVFELPKQWVKVAANNHYDLAATAPLDALIDILCSPPSEAAHAALSKLLDMDAWGRFGAFELLTQTHHFDEYHNWRLFWDPWRLKMEPIVWDPIGWAPDMRQPGDISYDLIVSRLHTWLHQNGDFLAARQRALSDFFTKGTHERFRAEVDWAVTAARYAIAEDPNIRPTDPARVEGGIDAFVAFYERIVRQLRLAYVEPQGRVEWCRPTPDTLRLRVNGRQPTSEVALRFAQPLRSVVPTKLRYRRFDVVHEVDLTGGVALQDGTLRVPARLFVQLHPVFVHQQGRVLRQNMREPLPACYELVFDGLPADNRLMDVSVVRGDRVEAAHLVASLPEPESEFVYRVTPPRPNRVPTVWRGTIDVERTTEVFEDVIVEPGTTVRLHAGASLIFRGRVTATGTEQAPIRFGPASKEQAPWGTLAINHPNCSGSLFRWCDVRGGSGMKVPLEEYCSMFSIHNCTGVRIEDCTFAENHQYDDMIHAMYSEVVFDRVALLGARMDALDCDISRAIVRHSRFVRSGNDGVDFMTANALVHDCVFEGNGDKGISIGEGTSLIGVRNRFDGCNKAMEAKDGSQAVVVNCEIQRCKKALNAYKKNWRYDSGGYITVLKSVVTGNQSLPTADVWSRADLVDCRVDGRLVSDYDQEYVDGTSTRMRNTARLIDHDGGAGVKHRRPLGFPPELLHLEAFAGEIWRTARTDVRGIPK